VLDAEIQKILDLGVELKCGVMVGKDISTDDLRKSYDAVIEACSASHPTRLGVQGEDAPNVYAAADFVSRLQQGDAIDIGKEIVVIGGGDLAVGAARECKRLGANVTILYRKAIAEMTALPMDVAQAVAEGVRIEPLVALVSLQREGEPVTGVRCIRMKLGAPDASGRQSPAAIEGSEFELPVSAVISAPAAPMVSTLIGQGRQAAEEIDARFQGKPVEKLDMAVIRSDKMKLGHYQKRPAAAVACADAPRQCCAADAEANPASSLDQAVSEAGWCMSCGYCFGCEKCWLYCSEQGIIKPAQKGALFSFKTGVCTGCKKCAEECPCGFIEMR
jgi:Pyruvate/2-oxoacid:ferredoxin oxidoreductase delta subunit